MSADVCRSLGVQRQAQPGRWNLATATAAPANNRSRAGACPPDIGGARSAALSSLLCAARLLHGRRQRLGREPTVAAPAQSSMAAPETGEGAKSLKAGWLARPPNRVIRSALAACQAPSVAWQSGRLASKAGQDGLTAPLGQQLPGVAPGKILI